mgnify:FL=1|tara:strand:- start:34 stop:1242 length:1209 start_codon:yes stop_codon:yes gene_type:complete
MRSPYKITKRESRVKKGWSAWTILFEDVDLKVEYKDTYFQTRDLAREEADKIYKNKLTNKIIPKSNKKTINEVFAIYIHSHVEPRYNENKVAKDQYNRIVYLSKLIKKHSLGKKIADDVIVSDVAKFYRDFKSEGKTRKTIQNYHAMMLKFISWCMNDRYMTTAPYTSRMIATLFDDDSKEFNVESISEENIQLILENVYDDTFSKLMFLMAIKTGMRAGEQLALTWDDVDFEKNLITINKNISEGEGTKADKLRKSNFVSGRKIPLNPDLKKLLLAWKMETKYSQNDQRIATRYGERFRAYGGASSSTYNFEGVPATYNTLAYILKHSIKKSGAVSLSWHSLRHYVASKLILTEGESKDNMKKISMLLGHSEIATTERVYAHLIALRDYQDQATLDMVASL